MMGRGMLKRQVRDPNQGWGGNDGKVDGRWGLLRLRGEGILIACASTIVIVSWPYLALLCATAPITNLDVSGNGRSIAVH